MQDMPTLRRFLTQLTGPDAVEPGLIFLIEDIASASQIIGNQVRHAALRGMSGAAGEVNVQGEEQKKLDVIADVEFARACANSPRLAALVSEEKDEVNWRKDPAQGDYLLYYDPLDGSSNIDVNLSVGTIFSICQVQSLPLQNVSRPGTEQICAGYAIYGPSTMLVLTTGAGVNGFTLDAGTGEFRLTHPNMTIPAETSEFAINASRYHHWDAPVRRYVDECLAGANGPRGRGFNMRWAASMVADVHRILVRGGVFLYPVDAANRDKGGKLRLLYEANPMAMITEQAGGKASTGHARILDLTPEGHHQRVSVMLGSKDEITLLETYHQSDKGS